MGFNPNFNNRNPPRMGNFSSNDLSNFHGANPTLQHPMTPNNQIGALQLLALQLQSNQQLHQQIHLLNQQLHAQNNMPASVQAPLLSHNLNPAIGLTNPQFLAQFQGLANPQFLAHNQMLQANQMAGLLGQNCMISEISNPNVLGGMRQNGISTSPVNTCWNKKNAHQFNGGQQFQVYHSEAERTCNPNANSQSSSSKGSARNFPGYAKEEPSHNRFQKPRLHDMRNSKENTKQFNGNGGRGQHNSKNQKCPSTRCEETKTVQRPSTIIYTEHDIKQWREARKKNFPTTDRIKKGPSGDKTNGDTDNDAKLRRQQLKEVLAKQAELGVEVAEVPLSYFCDPEDGSLQKEVGREVTNRPSNNNRPNGKRGPRGRGRNSWHAKRPKHQTSQGAHAGGFIVKREPSLLKKLLSADIKRDRSRLLQVFRFMVLNDFFKQWPDKALEFPAITAKDGDEISWEKDLSVDRANSAAVESIIVRTMVEEVGSQKGSGVAEEVENESDDKDADSTDGIAAQLIEEEENGAEDQLKRSDSAAVEPVIERTMVEEVGSQKGSSVAEKVENESDDEDADSTDGIAAKPMEEENGAEDQHKRSEEGEITD